MGVTPLTMRTFAASCLLLAVAAALPTTPDVQKVELKACTEAF